MTKQMFFNISTEKQNMFLQAAMSEFTTKPFEQVSVNTIVKKANISRGSFYTYFEDLESLFNYIIQDVRNHRFIYAKKLIEECNGEYFAFIRNLFEYDFDNYSESGKYSLFKNYVHYIQSSKKGSLKTTLFIESLAQFAKGKSLADVFNLEDLNINEEEFLDLVEMVFILMINTYLKTENEKLSKEESIRLFNKRIGFIEYGVRKRDKK